MMPIYKPVWGPLTIHQRNKLFMNPNYRQNPLLIITRQHECIQKCMQKVRCIIILLFLVLTSIVFYHQIVFLCMAHKRKRVLVHIKCPLFMRARKKVSRQPCFWGFPACIKWARAKPKFSSLNLCPFFLALLQKRIHYRNLLALPPTQQFQLRK